jgi:hypothetical protein
VVALAAAIVDADQLDVGRGPRAAAAIRPGIEEARRVDVVARRQRLEVARHRVRDPDLVVDRDGADARREVGVDRHAELGLGAGGHRELAAQCVELDPLELVDEDRAPLRSRRNSTLVTVPIASAAAATTSPAVADGSATAPSSGSIAGGTVGPAGRSPATRPERTGDGERERSSSDHDRGDRERGGGIARWSVHLQLPPALSMSPEQWCNRARPHPIPTIAMV